VMGTKLRNFAPLTDLALEELVPKDNPYPPRIVWSTIRYSPGVLGPSRRREGVYGPAHEYREDN
jgi:hypothetical protein